ncbi:MAG: hypothetical protein ABSA75_01670 [Candidatus Bathyarchaeia archaeon]|jgi:hypothetical protein
MENQVMIELQRLLESSSNEKQKRIFYTLDYVNNYFVGERREPTLSSQGFSKELQELKDIGAILTTGNNWRGYSYERLFLKQEIVDSIENLLHEKYYPLLEINKVTQKIQAIVKNTPPSALTKMWSTVSEFKITEYSLTGPPAYIKEVELLAERLAAEGLSYVIGYHSSSWSSFYKEIIFRKQPTDVREIFLSAVEEEIKKALASLSTTEKWCLYVMHVYPQADEKLLLKNATAQRLPLQIKQAFPKLPSIDLAKFDKNSDLILTEQKETQAKDLRSLINRDPTIVAVLGTLFAVAREEKNYRKVDSQAMKKLLETMADTETFNNYLSYLKSSSLVFETLTGDSIIPHSVWEALTDEIKGKATEIKFFEGVLDAQAFLEETISKAISDIKIWDPYVKNRTLAVLEKAVQPGKVTIEILTSIEKAKEGIETLIEKGYKIQTKIVSKKTSEKPWHDRYLIIDNEEVWHLGPSIDDAGIKPHESAVRFSSNFGALIVDAFKYNLSKKKEDWEKEGYAVTDI